MPSFRLTDCVSWGVQTLVLAVLILYGVAVYSDLCLQ